MIIQLESNREIAAVYFLGELIESAIALRDQNLIRRIRRLWDNDRWSRIKERWFSEGSTWYVYQMDGVRALLQLKEKFNDQQWHRWCVGKHE